jgi:hypothetical protein
MQGTSPAFILPNHLEYELDKEVPDFDIED